MSYRRLRLRIYKQSIIKKVNWKGVEPFVFEERYSKLSGLAFFLLFEKNH